MAPYLTRREGAAYLRPFCPNLAKTLTQSFCSHTYCKELKIFFSGSVSDLDEM